MIEPPMRRLEVDETMKHSKIIPRYLMILDAAVVLVSVSISFFLRLGFFLTMRAYIYPLMTITMLALIMKPIAFTATGLYRPYWGYVSWREISLTALASIVGTITLIAVYLLVSRLPFLSLDGFPRSVFGIDWLITLLGIGSIRWIAYSVLRQKERKISGLHKA